MQTIDLLFLSGLLLLHQKRVDLDKRSNCAHTHIDNHYLSAVPLSVYMYVHSMVLSTRNFVFFIFYTCLRASQVTLLSAEQRGRPSKAIVRKCNTNGTLNIEMVVSGERKLNVDMADVKLI